MEFQSGSGLKSIKSQCSSGVGRLGLVLKDNLMKKIGAAQWGGQLLLRPEEAMPSGPVGGLKHRASLGE